MSWARKETLAGIKEYVVPGSEKCEIITATNYVAPAGCWTLC